MAFARFDWFARLGGESVKTRKSFLLHFDSLAVLEDLSDEQAGKLFKAIWRYHIGAESDLDQITKIALAPFKAQFIRDSEKYEKVVKARSEAGKIGGKAKASKRKQKLANVTFAKQKVAKVTDSVSDSVSVSDSKNTKNVTPTASAPKAKKPKKAQSYDWPKPEGVDQQHWDDWLQIRRAKRLPISKTVMDKIEREAGKINWSMAQVIEKCAQKPWAGFEASWLDSEQRVAANTHDLSRVDYNVKADF